ncbi:MAG: hypothetical protein FJ215_13100 [Ignavibacteria bacterium]|nr:hypothetical protein [Ignavibacteria bacterium]
MDRRLIIKRYWGIAVILLILQSWTLAQDRTLATVVHELTIDVAAEIIQQSGFSEMDSVSVKVTGSPVPTIVENAFLRAFSERSVLVLRPSLSGEVLHLLVLRQDVQYRELEPSRWKRDVGLTIEARIDERDGTVRYLGTFSGDFSDTTSFREQWPLSARAAAADGSEEPTTVMKLLGPVLIVAGTVIMIYLLYTVRS